ncbi:hypothetical protein AGMMS50293_26980 [Spirochaetia bacterium]|nr:hypothetical protein AGMMS50293_26980 [Spirochaetia bacterium]
MNSACIPVRRSATRYGATGKTCTITHPTGGGYTRFFGFDSFGGFGELLEGDGHPFFVADNFETSLAKVDKRVKPFRKKFKAELIKGFFNESLKGGPEALGIKKARIILIDCDTYTAAKDAFLFCRSVVQEGTIIILDDRMSYRGNPDAGESRAFREFIEYTHIEVRVFLEYGGGSRAYIVSKVG